MSKTHWTLNEAVVAREPFLMEFTTFAWPPAGCTQRYLLFIKLCPRLAPHD
ncbi:MAG TPA: hypothetical protein VMF50_14695 [Candidatus Binataceae bacterium]|nr:hypothetical protein [Candidatus Binataceae bacterium]